MKRKSSRIPPGAAPEPSTPGLFRLNQMMTVQPKRCGYRPANSVRRGRVFAVSLQG